MAETVNVDLVVIGGGPAGYVAAIRAAQLGMAVACIERDKLGGVCLNWGCIPTKALLANAELYHKLTHDADAWGITVDNVGFDWEKVIGRSRGVAGQLNKGVHALFKKNKIAHVQGHAHIATPGIGCTPGIDAWKVEVYADDDADRTGEAHTIVEASKVLICTGAEPRALPFAPFDGEKIISSKQAMALPERPEKLLIIGSGAIGMEFAYFYNAFGTEVTVVEMLDRVLPVEDGDSSKAVEKAFKKHGVNMLTGRKTTSLEATDTGIKAVIEPAEGGEGETIEADKALVAIGVKGRYNGLFDDSLGLELFKDHIKVDYHAPGTTYQTSVPGIYAVGDVIGPPWLAHVASEEAILCVERMAGHEAPDIDYAAIPGCTYCHPQVASIGLTERAAKEQGLDYDVATFPFLASGKAQALAETTGFVKMITGKEHGELLGCHMVGEGVTELIAEASLGMRLEATKEEFIAAIHPHPTMSEATHEAALGTAGRMIHF